MSRQNLGAFIVSLAVLAGLVVVVFILPAIQPRPVEARNVLDVAADRAARRLNVVSRAADRAVIADRNTLTLPPQALKPNDEAITRAVASPAVGPSKSDLLKPTRDLADTFQKILAPQDDLYKRVARTAPVDAKVAELLQPPTGTSNQTAWIKQSLANKTDSTKKTLAEIASAISDLNASMSDAGSAGLNASDHFRANYVMGDLYAEKAVLLANLAANQRAESALVRTALTDQYHWYTDMAAEASAIQLRLKELTFTTPAGAPQTVPPAGAEPAAADRAAAAIPAPAPEPAATEAQTPSTQPAPADAQAAAVPPPARAPQGLPAAQEPAEVVARYEQQIDRQIADAQQSLAQLQQSMVQPQQQLEQAKTQAQQLQQQLAQVDQAGYDVTDTASFETYKKTYADLSARLRQVEVTIQGLQEGTMAGATVDPAGPDDLTKARYQGGTPQVGLNTLAAKLQAEQKVLADLEAAKKDMQQSRAWLLKYNQRLDSSLQQANDRCKLVLDQMNKTCEQLDGLTKAAAGREDEALAACKQAEQAFNTALQAARKDQGDAANELSAANPTPDKPNRRLEMLKEYGNPEVSAERGLVNVYMLIARIDMQRATDLLVQIGVLKMAQACGAQPADVDAAQKSLQEAINGATMALATPDSRANALYHAEQLSKTIQREKYAWLGAATRGLVYNMLAQVQAAAGNPQAADSRAKAVEALAEAVKGNENSEVLQPYSLLLASLKTADNATR